MTTPLHDAVRRFFEGLPAPVGSVLAAVSGGADSAAMLFALADCREDQGLVVHAGYLHHGQRPEADAEVTRLRMLCAELGVPFHAGRADVPAVAREEKVSLEVAGRRARYRFLFETAAEHGLDAVATAHTRDDQAETVLLRVLMGTGLDGLGGIAPVRTAVPPEAPHPTVLLRPLLQVGRAEVEATCRARGWEPVRDPSNLDLSYPRNRIRHEVLPALERSLNPGVREALARLAEIAREDDSVLDALVCNLVPAGATRFEVSNLQAMPLGLRRRVVRRLMVHAGATGKSLGFDAVRRVLAVAEGGRVEVGAGVRCESDGVTLGFSGNSERDAPEPWEVPIAIPGRTILPVGTLVAEYGPGLRATGPWEALLRASVLPGPLVARTRRPGDRIRLKAGTKKVGDLMTDRKVPTDGRDSLPLVAHLDEVIWLPGLAVSENYRGVAGGAAVKLAWSPPLFGPGAP